MAYNRLAATLHILFLSRRMLFASSRDAVRSIAIATAVAASLPILLAVNPFGSTENDLVEQRNLWPESQPMGYQYTIQLSGWQHPEALYPKRISENNRKVSSATYLWTGRNRNAGDPAPIDDTLWTIDRAFDELIAEKRRGLKVRVVYDDRWGFVKEARVDGDESQSGWSIEIRDFRAHETDRVTPD